MVTEREKAVYGALYDVTKRNMEQAGGNMKILKEALLSDVHPVQQELDVLHLAGLSKEAFFQAVFSIGLQRFPDDGTYDKWADRMDQEEDVFRKNIVDSIRLSQEAKSKRISIRNNLFPDQSTEHVHTVIRSDYSKMDKLYRVYQKLPAGLKRLVKKLMK